MNGSSLIENVFFSNRTFSNFGESTVEAQCVEVVPGSVEGESLDVTASDLEDRNALELQLFTWCNFNSTNIHTRLACLMAIVYHLKGHQS